MDETLGQYLRRKRESHLIPLQEFSQSTGIDIPVIKAIEENNFQMIPHPEMITKYLEKYSAFLKLNKKNVLRRYQMQCDLDNHKKFFFPQLSLFSEENISFRHTNRGKRLSRKRLMEGIFWSCIIIWAAAIFFFYIHVLSPKMETPEDKGIVTSRTMKKEIPRERNDVISPAASAKTEPPPVHVSGRDDRTTHTSSRNVVPSKRDNEGKISVPKAHNASPPPGKAKVVGNRDSKRYHLPGMKYFEKVKAYHRVVFNSETEAVKAGYSKAPE